MMISNFMMMNLEITEKGRKADEIMNIETVEKMVMKNEMILRKETTENETKKNLKILFDIHETEIQMIQN